jgi:hypothetical protein
LTHASSAHPVPRLTGVLLLCPQQRILYADPQIRALLGMPPEPEGLSLHDSIQAEAAAAVGRAMQSGQAPLPLPSGGSATVAVSTVVLDGRAEPGFVVRLLQDPPVAAPAPRPPDRR